jgi:disulfide bond formation protein DsbB
MRANPGRPAPALVWAAIALGSLGAVGAALYSQHVKGLDPCPWCILQRLIFISQAVVALVALLGGLAAPRLRLLPRGAGALIALLALCGLSAALYQNLVAAHLPSCDLTLADRIISGLGVDARWPEVFEVRASCKDAAVRLFGLPYEAWSGMLFLVTAVAAGTVVLRRGR